LLQFGDDLFSLCHNLFLGYSSNLIFLPKIKKYIFGLKQIQKNNNSEKRMPKRQEND
jgi:hypothetical protein